ncbi:MAG: prepilin-type N-terminal cleavage/methylation domain-containing protein [Stenotrophomonas sp.]|nr:prepilin-type N-terminal cleavage/methylation domain-containing protein [Xanthomonadales bacterium]MBN8767741.1 prepilin-type N-terminal cleavage/methylation domain-containing protein [Stenotrophomonas sp.]
MKRAAAGFTLIEILVAFGILALGLTLLLGTLSGASRQLRQGGDAGTAALHAQSLLAERALLPRQPGRAQGEFEGGRYRWQLQVTPWQDPRQRAAEGADPRAARLLQVHLEVTWGEGGPAQRLRIDSLRLALPGGDGAAP